MPEVVIVGGGVAGIATAYYLGKAGVRSTVIEKDAIAAHASGFAYGGLGPLSGAGIPGPMAEIAQASFRLHTALSESLPEESGIDFEFRSRLSLSLAFDEVEASALRAAADWQGRQKGFGTEWLDPGGLHEVNPNISPEAVGGCLLNGMTDLEPYKFVLALAQAAEELGAEVRHGVVTGLKRNGSRVTGVVTSGGVVHCDAAVLAAGPLVRGRGRLDGSADARSSPQRTDPAAQRASARSGLLDQLVAQLCPLPRATGFCGPVRRRSTQDSMRNQPPRQGM